MGLGYWSMSLRGALECPLAGSARSTSGCGLRIPASKRVPAESKLIKVMLRFYVGACKKKSIYFIFEEIIPVALSTLNSFEILENGRLSWLSLGATGRSWSFDRTAPVGLRI